MDERQKLRRWGLALRRLGLFFVTAALCGFALRSPAAGGLGTWVAGVIPTLAAIKVPAAPPQPRAQPVASAIRGGPLTFSVSGALSVGERNSSSVRGDASTGISSFSQNAADSTAGLLLQLGRRTPQTSLNLSVPAGASSEQRATFGQLQVGYYTPHFGLQYQPQALSALGLIPTGATLQSLTLVLPMRSGDVSFVRGTGMLDNQTAARVFGVRARALVGRGLYELGLFRGTRVDGQSQFTSLLGGFALDNGNLQQIFEGQLQRRSTPAAGSQNGLAYGYRADYGSGEIYSTLALRHTSDGFLSVGNGALHGDDGISLALHAGNFSIDEALVRSSSLQSGSMSSRTGALTYAMGFGPARRITSDFTLTDSRTDGPGGRTWTGAAGVQLGTAFADMDVIGGIQMLRSTSNSGGALSLMSLNGDVQRQFGTYTLQAQMQHTRQLSGGAFQILDETQAGLSRQWGLTSLSLSESLSRSLGPAVNVTQNAPLLTLARRISPTAQLSLSYGMQITRDHINPGGSGHSRIFNVQITAPFALGNGLVNGRADPRLPASILGGVINDVGTQGAFASTVSNGVGNVLVILDDAQTQRTDLSGRFQFSFVRPGHHTVRLDLGTLPRGVTPDQPIASIDVGGGQQGTLYFRIGTYAAVQGKVMRNGADGVPVPIAGAVLTIDGNGGIATTTPDGSYGFGRLAAGQHVIAVQNSSLPATVAFAADDARKNVTVRGGELVTENFLAMPLGSIAGKAMYAPALAPDLTGGAFNAYVVAEPGEFAGIVGDDGSFLIDNVPPGTYTVDIDPETVPEGTGQTGGPQTVVLQPGRQIEGLEFIIGHKIKPVVFSLKQTQDTGTAMVLVRSALPPGGATDAIVQASAGVKSVTVTGFDRRTPLAYDAKRKHWFGTIVVPLQAPAGTSALVAETGKSGSVATADLKVDPSIPLATFRLTPRNPARGQYVSVRAHFLADVRAGDIIRWEDGQITKLATPITGRIFDFTVKISIQPLNGLLLTRQGQLPISLR